MSSADVRSTIKLAFTMWSIFTPFTFIEPPSALTTDIRIGFYKGPHGDPFSDRMDSFGNNVPDGVSDWSFDGIGGVVAHAFSPDRREHGNFAGDIHFDDDEQWSNGDLAKGEDFLLNVALHQIGHALGLGHCGIGDGALPRTMFPIFGSKVNVPSPGDIEGVVAMYGPYKTATFGNGGGISDYDLKGIEDSAFAFDYDHSGKQDHLVLCRPGNGVLFILKNKPQNNIHTIFRSTTGLGGFDLRSPIDRGFAFDYDHSGKMDHIVFFRAGHGVVFIVRNQGGIFTPVYSSGRSRGIGNFDFMSPNDRCFAFDFDQTGRQDHIFCYRAGDGIVSIIRHNYNGTFESVYTSLSGIAGFDLRYNLDIIVPADCEGQGQLNYLIAYRPGKGVFWPVKHSRDNPSEFISILPKTMRVGQGIPSFNGVNGYDLLDPNDRIIGLPMGRLIVFRPGYGIFCCVNSLIRIDDSVASHFTPEFFSGAGLPGCDLRDARDGFVPLDYSDRGKTTDLFWYRRGTGFYRIWYNLVRKG